MPHGEGLSPRDAVMLASRAAEARPGVSLGKLRKSSQMPIVIFVLGFWAVRWLAPLVAGSIRHWRARVRESGMITLKLPAATVVAPKSLCTTCEFSHVIRGFAESEEQILCGYAFPPREIVFRVRECTDFRAEREEVLALADA